ncbi:MAG: biotin transporter BioY [Holosporales bacterium]|nr:biotin transporter BioY [Holosporales bacterium]
MVFHLKKEGFSVIRVLLSILFIMASAKFMIPLPFHPVPITAQLIAVYFVGLVLSPMESFVAVLGYVVSGICGLPVFCGGAWGSPGSGYLVGMIIAAPVIGILLKRGFSSITSCIGGCAIVHLGGCVWLAKFGSPFSFVVAVGMTPFLAINALKIAVVCGGLFLYKKIKQKKAD